jgi:hypothetical protein
MKSSIQSSRSSSASQEIDKEKGIDDKTEDRPHFDLNNKSQPAAIKPTLEG